MLGRRRRARYNLNMPDESKKRTLRLGARGSLLSRMQAQSVAAALEALHPQIRVELTIIVTATGDRVTDRPLYDMGGKGLFTGRRLEQAFLARDVDFVVHSYKDVPVTMPLVDIAELIIAAVSARANAADVLVCADARKIEDLLSGAQVGTSSLRRQAQLRALRPDLQIFPLRGNVDTRLRKLRREGVGSKGQYDAIILAHAGLARAKLLDPTVMTEIPLMQMLPAAGQGALALQCRRDAADVQEILRTLNDPATELATRLEREVVQRLEGDCHSPIAAFARFPGPQTVRLTACAAGRDGRPPVLRAEVEVAVAEADRAAQRVADVLLAQGAAELLRVR